MIEVHVAMAPAPFGWPTKVQHNACMAALVYGMTLAGTHGGGQTTLA